MLREQGRQERAFRVYFLSCLKRFQTKKGLNDPKVKSILSEVLQQSSNTKNHQCTCSVSYFLSFLDLPQLHCLIFSCYIWLTFFSVSSITENRSKAYKSKQTNKQNKTRITFLPFEQASIHKSTVSIYLLKCVSALKHHAKNCLW